MIRPRPALCAALVMGIASGCVPESGSDAGAPDAGARDAGPTDADPPDTGPIDAGPADSGVVDAGPPDMGFPDAAPPDTGPSLCALAESECNVAQECADDQPVPTNCEPCKPYNRSICERGRCRSPAVLTASDIYQIVMTVAPNVTAVESFATFAVAESTSGDRKLTCEDFYADRVSLDNDCLNVIDTRAYALPQTGDTYAVSFSGFASGQRTLFLIYGHRGAQPTGARLGVSCTEIDVAPPSGNGPYIFSGDTMLPLP